VPLENCKVDEKGRAVHEACYLADLEKHAATKKSVEEQSPH
jgi:hypothetical protein